MTAPRIDARRPKTGRVISLALFSIALLATACDMDMATGVLNIPGVIGLGGGPKFFATRLYGHVSLADGTPAGAGFSVVATIYKTGCDGETAGRQREPSTTDAEGRYVVRTYVPEWELLPAAADSADTRVLCTRLSTQGPLPGDTASVVIPDLVHRDGVPTDSVKVDLRLR